MTVTLINCFEIPEGREEEFRAGWLKLTAAIKDAPGYMGTTFYRRTSDFAGRFAFINVATWKDRDSWQAATSTPEFLAILKNMKDFPGYPGLFEEEYAE